MMRLRVSLLPQMCIRDRITRDQVNLNANYVEESAVDAVKNMGIGTNFGNCTDVVRCV